MALVGERKALAAAVLAFYGLVYLVNALMAPDPSFLPLFAAMAGMYGLAFFALVAGYFWARWFAIGVGLFGLIGGVMAMYQEGIDYIPLFYGGTHGLISLMLWGDKVSAQFDGRADWRERFHMDDNATRRLGKSVMRAGISLPILLIYGLMPRTGMAEALICAGVVGFAISGMWGCVRLRTWGVVAMLMAGVALIVTALTTTPLIATGQGNFDVMSTGLLGGILLIFAALPFTGPIARFLRR